MAERPLLVLPVPERISPPGGHGRGRKLKLPPKHDQVARFGPDFVRLRQVLDSSTTEGLELRDDPTSLAPDRVIVFELAGAVSDFVRAIGKVPGLEFMAEYDTDEPPDERFAEMDIRKDREGQVRQDKNVAGRFYLAMPDLIALRELVSLWQRWERGEKLGRGYAPFKRVFAQLRTLRPWGAEDRIPDDTIAYWQQEMAREPGRPIKTEVELWFYRSRARRQQASESVRALVASAGGDILDEAAIPEIGYHGLLINIPARELPALMERQEVHLALADQVMFLRPQSVLLSPLAIDPIVDDGLPDSNSVPTSEPPIAALLDGVPLQGHTLLASRLQVDDPDDLESRAIVTRRIHGTAMSSLIIHGDLNLTEQPLGRPLYVRPLMFAPATGDERTDENRLLVDTVYHAVLRMKGAAGEEPAAPSVFLVNISLGDSRRPFSRLVSPLARLLDFLSERFGVLFLVSAGNVDDPLVLTGFDTWQEFETANASDRERAVLAALNAAKHERTILSPAESLNALTIGAQHHDHVVDRPTMFGAVDPFDDHELPNPSSAIGLGHRRTIKPEIFLAAGREHLRMKKSGSGVEAGFGAPSRLYGLRAAAPDPSASGSLHATALCDGTSSATALATRAAHRIFDALMDTAGGSLLSDIPRDFYAVVVKALLVHRARWNSKSELLKDICGPDDRRRHVERGENASRFTGFGVPNVAEAVECASNRATLVGFGSLQPDQGHGYRIPMPECLQGVTDPRFLTVTVAWFSPVRPGHQTYRSVRFEASPLDAAAALGVKRFPAQPPDASVKRGTLFHQRYAGEQAVPFIDESHIALHVWCKQHDGADIEQPIRYGIAVTVEAETPIPIYEQIQQRLRIRPSLPT